MTIRLLLIRLLLLAALAAPALYSAAYAYDSYKELEFSRERLEKIRGEAGKMVAEAEQARRSANALVNGAVDAWGRGDGKQRILAAFGETKLTVVSVSSDPGSAGGKDDKGAIRFSPVIVRGSGPVTAVKEVLWNVGDLGPGIRLSSLQGELDPAKKTMNWVFSFLLVNPVEGPPKPPSSAGVP